MSSHADGCLVSAKKDALAHVGGFFGTPSEHVAEKAQEQMLLSDRVFVPPASMHCPLYTIPCATDPPSREGSGRSVAIGRSDEANPDEALKVAAETLQWPTFEAAVLEARSKTASAMA
jgi:hypothetical protein